MSDDSIIVGFLAFIFALFFGMGMTLYKTLAWMTAWDDDKRAIVAFMVAGLIVKLLIFAICLLGYQDRKKGRL